MVYRNFEDLPVFSESKNFVLKIYGILPRFGRDHDLMSQLKRAAVSVMLNIAEGFERKSNREFANFINIAKGSAGEARAILILAHGLDYIDGEMYGNLKSEAEALSKQLSKFNKYLLETQKKR